MIYLSRKYQEGHGLSRPVNFFVFKDNICTILGGKDRKMNYRSSKETKSSRKGRQENPCLYQCRSKFYNTDNAKGIQNGNCNPVWWRLTKTSKRGWYLKWFLKKSVNLSLEMALKWSFEPLIFYGSSTAHHSYMNTIKNYQVRIKNIQIIFDSHSSSLPIFLLPWLFLIKYSNCVLWPRYQTLLSNNDR